MYHMKCYEINIKKPIQHTAIIFNSKIKSSHGGINEVAERLIDMGNIVQSKTSNIEIIN